MRNRMWLAAGALGLGACASDSTSPTPMATARDASLTRSEDAGRALVYTLSNAVAGNAVIAFTHSDDGQFRPAGSFSTGGLGSGAGLGSQGAVVLSENGERLFAVNAGSNDITSFRVNRDGLTRATTIASGGTMPISVALHDDVLYVLNGGGSGNITGFRVDRDGRLHPIAGSTRALSGAGVGPAQVAISPDGRAIVVTEKGTNRITTYLLGKSGVASAPIVNASSGQTPFGFTFNQYGVLIVSEAFGGAANASAASTYEIKRDGSLRTLSASLLTTQTAACWFAITKNGRYAYATNTGSATVTGFEVKRGALTLLDANGSTANTNPTPIDAAFGGTGRFLYVVTGSAFINAFRVDEQSGALTPAGTVGGLPSSPVGLAVR